METYAIHKNAMIAPRKARMTLDLVRGKDIATARGILENTNTKAARLILKVLNSAYSLKDFRLLPYLNSDNYYQYTQHCLHSCNNPHKGISALY
jgi:hypothetical protein